MKKIEKILYCLFILIIKIEISDLNPSDSIPDLPSDSNLSNEIVDNDPPEDSATIEKKLCDNTQPLKGIKEECFKGNHLSSGETCCYMTIKYETNEHFACIAVSKDLSSIKNLINQKKQEYDGSKSVSIDCNSSLIQISLISLLFFIF